MLFFYFYYYLYFMNILLLHQYYLEDNGSGGSRWNEFTKSWNQNKDLNITVLSGVINYTDTKIPKEYKNKLFVKKKQNDIDIYRCFVYEGYNSNFLGRLIGYFSFVISSLIVGLFYIDKKKYDVIIVSSPPLFIGITGYLLSFFKKIPFVFEIRDLWPESAVDTGVVKNKFIIYLSYKLEAFLYKKATLINVLTPAFKKSLVEQKNVNPNKIIYIPNASDFSLSDKYADFNCDSLKEQFGLSNKFIVSYVGAHGVANKLEQILETANYLKDKNTAIHFLLIGQGMKKDTLIAYSQKLHLTNVTFIDPVPKEEIFKYILMSDVCTSVLKKCDTFKTVYSNKTFDYMSCKKPILMAIDGVSRELIEEAQCGIFVEPENHLDFAEKVLLYYNNKELMFEHGRNGYIFAKTNFDRIKLADKYITEINAIL